MIATTPTDAPATLDIWHRPDGRGQWRKYGTATTQREALDMIEKARLKCADWWIAPS